MLPPKRKTNKLFEFNGSSHPLIVDTEEREKREEETAGARDALLNQNSFVSRSLLSLRVLIDT